MQLRAGTLEILGLVGVAGSRVVVLSTATARNLSTESKDQCHHCYLICTILMVHFGVQVAYFRHPVPFWTRVFC